METRDKIQILINEFDAIRIRNPDGDVPRMIDRVEEQFGKTDREFLTLIGAATGTLLVDKGFGDIHEYAERALKRPIFTHEFAFEKTADELRVAATADIEAS